PLEMIEPELGFQVLVLLLDCPALMRESNQLPKRRGRRQIHEVILGARRAAHVAFAQEPHFGNESAMAPVVRGCHAEGETRDGPATPLAAVAPGDAAPGPRRCRRGDRFHAERLDPRCQVGMFARPAPPGGGGPPDEAWCAAKDGE